MSPTGSQTEARTERFEAQKKILKNGHFFKLICGAGNEDPEEVYKLTLVYTLAGALGIDLSARKTVVNSAAKALDDAEKRAEEFGIKNYIRPYLTVSVGMPGDPHVRKAKILSDPCTKCNACIPVCPTDAIPNYLQILEERCIGCGECGAACQDDAIGYTHKDIEIGKALRECVDAGAENIELHAAVADEGQTMKEWKVLCDTIPNGFVSVCLDRGHLSNNALKNRIGEMLEIAKGRMIVQADGIPMSGGEPGYNTTLQAIATADIIAKMQFPVHLLLSGGTNGKSIELAKQCDVPYAGVSIGTFARHLVYKYINDPEFPNDKVLTPAVATARELVETCYAAH